MYLTQHILNSADSVLPIAPKHWTKLFKAFSPKKMKIWWNSDTWSEFYLKSKHWPIGLSHNVFVWTETDKCMPDSVLHELCVWCLSFLLLTLILYSLLLTRKSHSWHLNLPSYLGHFIHIRHLSYLSHRAPIRPEKSGQIFIVIKSSQISKSQGCHSD